MKRYDLRKLGNDFEPRMKDILSSLFIKSIAGKYLPCFSLLSLEATPQSTPSIEKESEPFHISRRTPIRVPFEIGFL